MNRLLATTVSALLVVSVAACGGDSASGGATKSAIVDMFVTEAEKEGASVDRECAEKAIADLSDDDAKLILAAGVNGDPDVSADAKVVASALIACIGDFGDIVDTVLDGSIPDVSIPDGVEVTDAMIDAIVTSIEQSGATVDRDCIAEAISGMDLAEIVGQAGTMSPEFVQRFIGCVTP